jgi:hypothetical protein
LAKLNSGDWEQFVKNKLVKQLIIKNKLLSNNNSKRGFFQKKGGVSKELSDCYVKTKEEICNALVLRIDTLINSNDHGNVDKLKLAKQSINDVCNMHGLENFVKDLAKIDTFFDQFIFEKASDMEAGIGRH